MVSKSSHEAGWINCNKYTAEYVERFQSALDYQNKIKNLKKIKREDKGLEFARGEKDKCIGDLEKIIGDKLGSICIDCGLDSYLELTRQKGYENAKDRGISMRRLATLLAVHGADPLECGHWFSDNPQDGEGLLLHIMTAMNYLNDLEVFIHQRWEISKLQENDNSFIKSNDAIGRADRISRTNPTAIRFTYISFLFTSYLIRDSGYFNEVMRKIKDIDSAMSDLFDRDRENTYFYTPKDLAWPIVDKLACSLDELNEKNGRNIDLETFLNHDDAYFNLSQKQFLKKNDNIIVVTDPHESVYGTYKAVLDNISTPEGKEGEPFEKLVQWVASMMRYSKILPGPSYVSGESVPDLEVDFVVTSGNILIIGECKYKGRYYDPDAGVKHVENDIIGEGWKQISKRRSTLLNYSGILRTEQGIEVTCPTKEVNYVVPIIVHNQEYIPPECKDSGIKDDNYGVHSFSIEGFMIAIFTCPNIFDFLTYLKFRREYIKVHEKKFFNARIFDELDICTSFVNGGGGTYDLKGKYRLVTCEVYTGNDVCSIGRWREFLDEIYHWEEFPKISNKYRDVLISSVVDDIKNIVKILEQENNNEATLNMYERGLYKHYESENKGKSMHVDSLKELAKSYISFEI